MLCKVTQNVSQPPARLHPALDTWGHAPPPISRGSKRSNMAHVASAMCRGHGLWDSISSLNGHLMQSLISYLTILAAQAWNNGNTDAKKVLIPTTTLRRQIH